MLRFALCALVAFLVVACDAPSTDTTPSRRTGTEPHLITGTAVRVRSAPSLDAPIVGKLRLGVTVIVPLDEQPRDTSWVRVRVDPPHGSESIEGYIHAGLTRRITRDFNRTAVAAEIANERLGRKSDGFEERVELFDWLTEVTREPADHELAGRVALLRIRALRSVLASIPFGRRRPPYDAWVEGHQDLVVYNEPGGEWLVRNDALQAVHDEHIESSSSDELAWMVYDNGLGGECEGYVTCYISWLAKLNGQYLRDHPEGRYAPLVLQRVTDLVKGLLSTPVPSDYFNPAKDCTEMVSATAALRSAIEGTSGTERDSTIALLDQLARPCNAGPGGG
jgi:hypothetical protein